MTDANEKPAAPSPAPAAPAPTPAASAAPAASQAAPAPGHQKAAAFTGGEAEFAEMPPLIEGRPDFGDGALTAILWGTVIVCGLFVVFGLGKIFGVIKAYYF